MGANRRRAKKDETLSLVRMGETQLLETLVAIQLHGKRVGNWNWSSSLYFSLSLSLPLLANLPALFRKTPRPVTLPEHPDLS
jgi:hypothetical protein